MREEGAREVKMQKIEKILFFEKRKNGEKKKNSKKGKMKKKKKKKKSEKKNGKKKLQSVHWSDLQRSHTPRFTRGAVAGRVVMKNQAYLTACAAPRSGFLDIDWSGPWITAASAVGLLGADFVLYGISNNCVELQLRSAEFQRLFEVRQKLSV